jgi:S-DNA-T family DNA segregation ATPase FtsK/SpoIIIE
MAGRKRPQGNSYIGAAAAIGGLPPRRSTWPNQLFIVLGLGTVAVGLLVVVDRIAPAVLVGVGAVLIAAAFVVFGIRAQRRGGLLDTAIEAICPILGARTPNREIVRASRWSGGWIGLPGRIQMRYAATVDDVESGFVEGVLEQINRRLGAEYRVIKHLPKKCVLIVGRDLRDQKDNGPEVARAKKVAKELLGVGPAKVTCVTDDEGAVLEIRVRHDIGARVSMAGYRQRVEKALSSMLPGRWRAHWDLEKDEVRFEIRPSMPTMIQHLPGEPRPKLTHSSYDACKIAYCVDEDGYTQFWRPSVSPHMLIIGGTGSGKTAAEHTLLTDLALYGWKVWVLDGKRIEFAGYKDWPNVELVASKVGDQVRMIHAAHDLMEQRYSMIEDGRARISDFDPLVLIIDEYATFKARVQRWYKTVKPKGGTAQPPVFDLISDLARLARTAKIHLVVGIQRPDADFLGGEMRDNFGARLSLGRLSPQGANMMWDSFAIGVAIPRNQRGRGVALNEQSNPVEVQTFYTPDPAKLLDENVDGWAQLEQLKPAEVTYPRKMILEPKAEIDGDKGELLEPMYEEWANALIVPYDASRDRSAHADTTQLSIDGTPPEPIFDEADREDDSAGTSDAELFEGYGDPDAGALDSLEAGDLVLVDESLSLWGVVEECEIDLLDEGYMSVDYRDLETGEPSTISLPESDKVTMRRPTDR